MRPLALVLLVAIALSLAPPATAQATNNDDYVGHAFSFELSSANAWEVHFNAHTSNSTYPRLYIFDSDCDVVAYIPTLTYYWGDAAGYQPPDGTWNYESNHAISFKAFQVSWYDLKRDDKIVTRAAWTFYGSINPNKYSASDLAAMRNVFSSDDWHFLIVIRLPRAVDGVICHGKFSVIYRSSADPLSGLLP